MQQVVRGYLIVLRRASRGHFENGLAIRALLQRALYFQEFAMMASSAIGFEFVPVTAQIVGLQEHLGDAKQSAYRFVERKQVVEVVLSVQAIGSEHVVPCVRRVVQLSRTLQAAPT